MTPGALRPVHGLRLDSTLVGGSRALIDAVLADTALKAWPGAPGDSLAYDGDTVIRQLT